MEPKVSGVRREEVSGSASCLQLAYAVFRLHSLHLDVCVCPRVCVDLDCCRSGSLAECPGNLNLTLRL